MIGTLIEIARLSNGRQAPDTQPSKLERIVGDVVIQCNPFAVAANRPIELAAFTVDVATDARLCSAAVKGLLLYAIKHGTGDRTAIDVHRRGRSIRLDIAYDGPPPDAALAKQAFIQLAPVAGAPSVPPRPMQGIGLALAPQLCACLGLGFEHGRSRSRSHRLSLVFRR